jgi:flavin reductase (DIM6/NTAB) family NADH-FMN oxidoreductase RutF
MIIDPQNLNPKELYQLLIDVIVPRPIAFVSTVNAHGVPNLSPFSFFTGVTSLPPSLCISITRRRGDKKDTLLNIEATRDFVVNIVDEDLAEAMNIASADYPREISEFERAGLTPVQSHRVKSPRVAEAPLSLECRLLQIVEVGAPPYTTSLVLGEILQFHIREGLLISGRIDFSRLKAIGRLGGDFYCRTRDLFEMKKPLLKT